MDRQRAKGSPPRLPTHKQSAARRTVWWPISLAVALVAVVVGATVTACTIYFGSPSPSAISFGVTLMTLGIGGAVLWLAFRLMREDDGGRL